MINCALRHSFFERVFLRHTCIQEYSEKAQRVPLSFIRAQPLVHLYGLLDRALRLQPHLIRQPLHREVRLLDRDQIMPVHHRALQAREPLEAIRVLQLRHHDRATPRVQVLQVTAGLHLHEHLTDRFHDLQEVQQEEHPEAIRHHAAHPQREADLATRDHHLDQARLVMLVLHREVTEQHLHHEVIRHQAVHSHREQADTLAGLQLDIPVEAGSEDLLADSADVRLADSADHEEADEGEAQ